jgi:hypothetical protein
MRALGRRLRRVLDSRAAYEILGPSGGTWMAGGCWILAEALQRCLRSRGYDAHLYAVRSREKEREVVEHVVVGVRGNASHAHGGYEIWFLDGDGAATSAELLDKMRRVERVPSPYLTRFTKTDAKAERAFPFGIVCPPVKVERLSAWLCERL